MSADPVLIIQPRRMGDLILTFPLVLHLHRKYPESPIWVSAQESFFKPLMPFAPGIVFFPHTHLPELTKCNYEAAVNLGGDEYSARYMNKVMAPAKYGLEKNASGGAHVSGFWNLYRASLTRNNRHNLFHWSDLFRMDMISLPAPHMYRRLRRPANGRIGLFIGASETSKRPAPAFWAGLSSRLSNMGFKPVLLGGPSESALGQEIMNLGARAANFCGKTDLTQLAGLLKTLDLLITPDTGPMHLADWLNTPVLNLSMGNVHASETGPMGSGQYVLRASMSCSGCWRCTRGRLFCHLPFKPSIIASLAAALVKNEAAPPTPGLQLFKTGRDELGLHCLNGGKINARSVLDQFWKASFLKFFDAQRHNGGLTSAAQELTSHYPQLGESIRSNLAKMLTVLARSRQRAEPLPDNFWHNQPWHSRLFAGHMQMALQNEEHSLQSWQTALQRVETLQIILA